MESNCVAGGGGGGRHVSGYMWVALLCVGVLSGFIFGLLWDQIVDITVYVGEVSGGVGREG